MVQNIAKLYKALQNLLTSGVINTSTPSSAKDAAGILRSRRSAVGSGHSWTPLKKLFRAVILVDHAFNKAQPVQITVE